MAPALDGKSAGPALDRDGLGGLAADWRADGRLGASDAAADEATADERPGTEESTAGGRHLVPDELVQAATYRLTPDRVARAKVREAIIGDEEGQETTRLSSVPRPRSS